MKQYERISATVPSGTIVECSRVYVGSLGPWDPGTVVLEIPKGFLRGQQDPRFEFPKSGRPSVFLVFFCVAVEVAFWRVWWPTWPQHGSNLGPKRPPKSRKIYKKRDHILDVVFD